MKIIIYIFIFLILVNKAFSEGINIYYPADIQELCRTTPIVIKWEGSTADVIVEIKNENDTKYNFVLNYQINNNTFVWTVNDAEYLNTTLSVKVSDKNNPEIYDEFHGITIFSETEILHQTQSVQVCSGDDIYLQVDALGYNLSYQWYRDNNPVDGAVSSVLRYSNADYSMSGTYVCKIKSNSPCDIAQSKPISVYVATPTEFTTRPEEVFWEYNKSATMTALLHGNNEPEINNVKFRWFKDTIIYTFKPPKTFIPDTIRLELKEGKKYIGTKSQDLEITKLVWSDRTTYYCVADGLCGSDTVSCEIGDESRFEIIKVSPDFYGCEGQDVTFKATVVTEVEGTFTYQWYKSGFKKLIESEKFIGTQTRELTIKNTDYDEDFNIYYVLVTWVEKKVSKRSEHFVLELNMLPKIYEQPRNTFIKDRTNKFFGQTYIDVIVKNDVGCMYTWYRNGKQARKTCHRSDYWLGIDSCPPYPSLYPPPPRASVPEDVGWYRCKIENECGVTWTDSVYVAWDYNELYSCIGKDIAIEVKDLGENYSYIWEFDGKELQETDRIKNVESSKLIIRNLKIEDHGNYLVWTVDKNSNTKTLYSKVFVEVITAPFIQKDFPNELTNDGDYIKQIFASVISNGPFLDYEVYLDKVKIHEGTKFRNNLYNNDYGFLFGGKENNVKPGVYQYLFRNDCGEVWSNKMKVTNTAYKPEGIILPDNDLVSSIFDKENSITIYPNPASDYIIINFYNKGLKPNEAADKVQIFDFLGLEVVQISLIAGNNRINISQLPTGVYFLRIGHKVEKFVKM
ncbi:MAG: T9SS type A sorting domain-containing protein [Candidatus Kapabacteria bacterium]|nr:T9SS type A sorting domain-containing protein [Ignavibacteriota bacterium]MCW5883355.1 T9SS type A sorting domain-containing protein [Candidatus Kapabacteria bacterium]